MNQESSFTARLREEKEQGIGLKKRKKSFGETRKWITFAELSPEKIGVKGTRLSIRTNESSLKIFEKERRQTTNE